MKYTICVTQQCNLACAYCYVGKNARTMTRDTSAAVIDFAFSHTPPDARVEFGFFGGEPLLAFDRVREMTAMIERHPDYSPQRVEMTVVSNGTLFDDAIADFLLEHGIGLGISCDGPPDVQNRFRRTAEGHGVAGVVEGTLTEVVRRMPLPMVNAVYRPETLDALPRTVRYFSELGLRRIYLNPDFTAPWTAEDAARLPSLFREIGGFYVAAYDRGDTHFISMLDAKMGVILRGGYAPGERCSMGREEFAFSASGHIYPCERLLGDGEGGGHCIGHVESGLTPSTMGCHSNTAADTSDSCMHCGIRAYCMNWCGCSNFMSTGSYNSPGAFLCASERAAVTEAARVIDMLKESEGGPHLLAHLFSDTPVTTSATTR